MSIRTRLIVIGLLLAVLPVIVGAIFVSTARRIESAERKVALTADLEKNLFELTLITHEFSRFGSVRAARQLRERERLIEGLLDTIAIETVSPRETQLLKRIRRHQQRIRALTAELTRSVAPSQDSEADTASVTSWRIRLVGQLLIAKQNVLFYSRQLQDQWRGELAASQQMAERVVLGVILAMVVVTAIGLLLLYRGIAPPLQRLTSAVSEFARGNRNVRMETTSRDEIGVVCDTFNDMAAELQVHQDQLESLVERRTEELAHANETLEQSNVELQQFAYIASHDLQTPLRGIAGFANLLMRQYQGRLDKSADDYIERIVAGTKRMQMLISDLLTYSRVESRAVPFKSVDLNAVFKDVVTMLESSIKDADAVVTHDELPTVAGDRSQLSHLLQNLIANGIKYHGEEPPRVHISAHKNHHEWTISVQDNGIGIDVKHHERIFDIFRRLHTQEAYPGTGIGLAVCRRITHRHGGKIWLESELGKGSTFFFTISERARDTGACDEQ